jgi:endonuclease III
VGVSGAFELITFDDFEWIFPKIDTQCEDAQKLYISHKLKFIEDEQDRAFSILLAVVVSLRTKEKVTWTVSEKTLEKVKTIDDLISIPLEELTDLLYPCGFYRRKAEQLKKTAVMIRDDHHGLVPDSVEELLAFPGVGRKAANLVVTDAYNKPGICVDIHVHRIMNRWNLVETDKPDDTEMVLRETLPLKYWMTINKALVLMGQNICLPRGPKCGECFLKDMCPVPVSLS